MTQSLLQSKFTIPELTHDAVLRPNLLDLLGNKTPLTLVVAPAGYGKTTLVSQWVHQAEVDVAWLSLDGGDNDPARFLDYLAHTLSTIQPLIAECEASEPMALLTQWLNVIGESERSTCLVLDDYHHVANPDVHEIVTFLLEHPILQFRLVLLSRAMPDLPIGRLRPKQQLTEIDMAQLRFDETAMRDFFRATLGIQLSPPQLQEVMRRD